MSIKFYTEVEKVERRTVKRYLPGTWAEAKGEGQVESENVDLGYFLHLKGSHESLFIGEEQPEFKAGDRVSVVIQLEKPVALTSSNLSG